MDDERLAGQWTGRWKRRNIRAGPIYQLSNQLLVEVTQPDHDPVVALLDEFALR